MDILKLFIPTFIFYFVIDYVWIAIIASKFYSQELGDLVRRNGSGGIDANLIPGFIVYVLLVSGLIIFVYPRIQNKRILPVIVYGFLFGVITYGVYNLTNLAILDGFGARLAIADMLWGGVVCVLTALFLYYFHQLLHKKL